MSVELTDREHQIIQQLILDRWNPHRINKKIANHHGLTINQVKYMRSKPAFKADYDKQLAIYLDSFDDIQLADRKERVKAMVMESYNRCCDGLTAGNCDDLVGSDNFTREVLLHPEVAGVARSLLGVDFRVPRGGHITSSRILT